MARRSCLPAEPRQQFEVLHVREDCVVRHRGGRGSCFEDGRQEEKILILGDFMYGMHFDDWPDEELHEPEFKLADVAHAAVILLPRALSG